MIYQTEFDAFQTTRGRLKTELNWRSAGPMRDAVALAILPSLGEREPDLAALKDVADILKQNNLKLQMLRSAARYAVAALLLNSRIDPDQFLAVLEEGRRNWKQVGLRRTSPYEGASLILLALIGTAHSDRTIYTRIKTSFDNLKSNYFWNVGAFTLPAITLANAHRPDAEWRATERFSLLRENKIPRRFRMSCALLATLNENDPHTVTTWIRNSYHALKSANLGAAAQRTPSLAIASLSDLAPDQLTDRVREIKSRIKNGPYRSSAPSALALTFVNSVELGGSRHAGRSSPQSENTGQIISVMAAVQSYIAIQEQNAAMVAIIGGAAVAGAS